MKSHELQVSLQTFRKALADYCKRPLSRSNFEISKQRIVIEFMQIFKLCFKKIGDYVHFMRNLNKMPVIITKVDVRIYQSLAITVIVS